ncbi:DUF4012 domain-containing protein [Nocardioides jishulii]|uniref:DUF4012 domain-containing protein n=1 Tax=Nocardioides jishulii TaxID=2575440 RepID=UPI00148566C6|nr:DUF4012 domain-containing protein [Nocardioides jishulii]
MSYVRRHWLMFSLGVLGFLLVVLGLLALPLRGVPADASAAQDELTKSVTALGESQPDQGWKHLAKARAHVDDVTAVTNGPSGWFWGLMPGVGSGVRDVRHLASAMDDMTSALEVAEELYPEVSGEDSKLLDRGSVDLEVLERAVVSMEQIGDRLRSAQDHLHEVDGTNSLVGATTAEARDSALRKVDPAVAGFNRIEPLLGQMPDMLGKDGKRTYVVALMNPAEMKFSGGSMLTFSHVDLDSGTLVRGRVRDVVTAPPLFKQFHWEPVEGNTFATDGARRITHANIAPSWPVAGEETLRAWEILTRMEPDGVIALDVQALARLLDVTGPLEVEEVGTVTSANLVQLTSGDYARFSLEEQRKRKRLNKALIPAFMDRIFSGVDFVGTMLALNDSAKGRHLALYLRDDDAQEAMARLGFDGDLSDTDGDYVGVFTQNLVGSKADYFQQKTLTSDVKLRGDGSARVTLEVTLDNLGPASMPGEMHAYTDPTLEVRLAALLPKEAELVEAISSTPAGVEAVEVSDDDYFGRPFVTQDVRLTAGTAAGLRLTYEVPNAAVLKNGTLTYRLDVDPHPTVRPENVKVTVRWPPGFTATDLPEGWESVKGTARRKLAPLSGVSSWTLRASQ